MRTLILALACTALVAQAPDPLGPVRFLAGTWVGEGTGEPGRNAGEVIFTFELGGKALVRHNATSFPAQEGRAAFVHSDLMTIYPDGSQLKALYLDSEGHVIHYNVTAKGEDVVFLSEPQPGPTFRFIYRSKPGGALYSAFAIAPPGKPEAFTTHVEGEARRKR